MQSDPPNDSLYRALIEASPDAIMFTDLSGIVRYANQRAAEMGGFDHADKMIGLNIFEFIVEPDKMEIAKSIESLIRGKLQETFEATLRRLDGSTYAADLTGSVLWDEQHRPAGLLTITRDITERKSMEKILNLARIDTERANHLKDAFIANISHEIRTPLNAILGFTELIREEGFDGLPEQTKSYFPLVESSCQRLIHTVEMMLDLSKLQSGMFAPTRIKFDPDEILNGLVSDYQKQAARKFLTFNYLNLAGPLELNTDLFCLRQPVSTLLENALKYTDKGSITITFDKNTDHSIIIKVCDTGIGMRQDYIDRIFESFSQEETGTTRRYPGIGLSLSIAKRLLNAIGAEISVTSRLGEGSEFTITIPIG